YINIKPKDPSESIRILGVWFNVNDNKNFVLSQAKSEVKRLIDNIKHKRISDKQLQYVFNALIIPTIEYRAQRMPTAIINHNLIYNIKDIADNQLQQLNDTGLLGKIMPLRLKQLQHKFWIEDNIVSVFPFNNNFYKKLFYSKKNYDNWILENIKILKYNNIDISVNNKLSIEKYKITGDKVPIRNILGTEKFFNNLHRIKKDGVMFLDQLIGISNSYLINSCTLKLKSFREDTRVLIKKSGIDGQNNLIIGHLNIINNVDFRSSVIQLQKCSGCELDNIEQLSEKNYNCNILINANNSLIIGVQSNIVYHSLTLNNNNLKVILQTNLLDITDLSYNDFLFKNNWKNYEITINQSNIEDKVESTYFTSMFSSKRKKQSVNLLTEEIPTVKKRKYLAHKIFDNWKCFFLKEFFEETCNSLLVKAKKDPIIDNELINKMTFWDRTYSEMKITFIDLIKEISFLTKVGTFGLIGA
ncbi:hypothetical protein RhiirC2_788487, partial [Rhizophagus irregularis]